MTDRLSPINHREHMVYLSSCINELHYRYLCAHESLEKLKEKERLEDHIQKYLMLAPHDEKFCFPETANIIHKSAELKENFNGVKASTAWTAIAAYAHNLLAQSWRKEYREIKTYSGFYKHNIDNGLVGSELMLTLMGYRETGEGIFALDGPVDPDKVANVSRDSFVALVECQILCSVFSELARNGCAYSWLDILAYRESHPCSLDQAISGLLFQYNQKYINPCRMDCYPKCNMVPPYKSPYYYQSPNTMNLPYYDVPDSLPLIGLPYHTGNYNRCSSCHNHSVPLARQSNSVPTGQLIELDTPYSGRDSYIFDTDIQRKSLYDKVDPTSRSSLNTLDNGSNFLKQKSRNGTAWDSLGATYLVPGNKINSKYETPLDQKQLLNSDWQESFKSLHIDDTQPSCSNSESKVPEKVVEKVVKKKTRTDSSNPVPSVSQTLGREQSKKTDFNNYSSLKVKLNDTKWDCPFCTFHNTNDKDVCDMCSKSKVSGNEIQPLMSGGRHCPECTLVNAKGVDSCEACGTDLKDSPTYI